MHSVHLKNRIRWNILSMMRCVCVFIFFKNESVKKDTSSLIDQADVRYLFNAWCPMKGHTHLNKPAQAIKGYYKRVMTKIHNKSKK